MLNFEDLNIAQKYLTMRWSVHA